MAALQFLDTYFICLQKLELLLQAKKQKSLAQSARLTPEHMFTARG